jgi:hypothetical protein
VIYNFRIGCWVHFSFKISSLGRSNKAKSKCLVLERGRRGRRHPCRAPSVPPLYARTSRQAGVHRPERCAQAPVLDVGGPWSVPHVAPCPRHTTTGRRVDDYGYRLSMLLKP